MAAEMKTLKTTESFAKTASTLTTACCRFEESTKLTAGSLSTIGNYS